ncbi:MAG TPA: nucleotidyltransferase [Muricauda sp.]|uniref:Nucleotidyltransferase n=1 Tax=Flagellimonas aurea TaxID=2915619 RepID=A0ABS3G2R7_9FLAO|nr:sugar phosphate nucleotidyltransferase [Allomuricauda aurea]MAO18703.1 nucleotidyltransferase [Allomuricauda sp.]MBC72596.1 nucleotidyltransferase [Allomuricauda sp.]MBO0352872.1 nucleotidyltransferase [Allomuricauda aurea]HBU76677.1 nucleotidyltransferase [Allomuricauda sp.]|tara:strand:- start:583 stop:1599 length:1017 start_codon:yes stop_codon:yes gene_type:complete
MKIIVPMAGRGSRLRPHTLTVPKPLIPVAGKPIVHRLVTDIAKVLGEPIEEVAFILGDPAFFGDDVVESLMELADELGAKGSIYRQDQPLGTGHAIMSAKESLSGPAVIAYADTLIRADFDLDKSADSVIWVKQVERPEAYGVVQLNDGNEIVELVEKPQEYVSDLAVIGIYYFKDVEVLKNELQHVLDHDITHGGEYQINDGIKRMMEKGMKFVPGKVDEWMDCGNKNVTVETNQRMLGFLEKEGEQMVANSVKQENANIIEPCFIGENVVLKNTTVGPYVSIGANTVLENSTVKNSLIQSNSKISNANLDNAMIGNYVVYNGNFETISIGDYSVLE